MGTENQFDLTLMAAIAQKDRDAFKTLYFRYAQRLANYLAKFLWHKEGIEEVVNDTLMVVWERANRFDSGKKVSSWIFGISHKKMLKYLEKNSKHYANHFELDSETEIDTFDASSVSELDLNELIANKQILEKALSKLPLEQRCVIELAFLEGYAYNEIAEIVGIPNNTVKTRVFHARNKLIDIISKLESITD